MKVATGRKDRSGRGLEKSSNYTRRGISVASADIKGALGERRGNENEVDSAAAANAPALSPFLGLVLRLCKMTSFRE